METSASFIGYYKALFKKFLQGCRDYWVQEVSGHAIFSVFVFLVTYQSDPDATTILKAALKANLIWLALYSVIHIFRSPWLLAQEQARDNASLQEKLIAEESKNEQAEVRCEIRQAQYDISYQPEYQGLLLAFEINLWNSRQVPTTIKKVALTVFANNTVFVGNELSLSNDVRSGPNQLKSIIGKIWPQNPLRYNMHESGWLLFFVKNLAFQATSQTLCLSSVKLDFIDASDKVHSYTAVNCVFKRGNLQEVFPGNTLRQFRISL